MATKLPDGATAVAVGVGGEYIIVTPANAYHPPVAEFIKGGRKTRLVPADRIRAWANESLDNIEFGPEFDQLIELLDRLEGKSG